MRLSEILFKGEFSSEYSTETTEIEKIETDQNKIDSSTLFVFIRSINFDIKSIITTVLSKKPKAIICDYSLEIGKTDIPVFKVENTRKILSFLFSRFYKIDYSKSKFIGITGTNGKTTTATLVKRILRENERNVGFIGTGKIEINEKSIAPKNYSMTTPDPYILYAKIKEMTDAGCEFIVMEVTSHALSLEKTSPIEFEVGVFTNLSSEHMDFHESMEDYYKTKLKMFKNVRCGIFNVDDAYSRRAKNEFYGKSLTTGVLYDADNRAKEIKDNGLSGSEYIFASKKFIFKAKTKLVGSYNVYNTMMAISVCTELGIEPCKVKKALEKIEYIEGRFEKICGDITVIIDYAHTEAAYDGTLKTIKRTQNSGQKLICVFGCGGNRDKTKRPRIAETTEKYADVSVITEDNPRDESGTEIIKDILNGFKKRDTVKIIPDRKSAIEYAIATAREGDTVAVIGKGHERYYIDAFGYHDFDERLIINNALQKRKNSEKR